MNNNTQLNGYPQGLTMLRTYLSNSWKLVPIPYASKAPINKGWQEPDNLISSELFLRTDSNYGLAHAYSGTMALDIDNWPRAVEELMKWGIDLHALYTAPDSVAIHSGRSGHAKLIYRMPDGLTLPSKKLIDKDASGKNYNYLDFRCATSNGGTAQDVLPPSIHPDTMQPYRWVGNGDWRNPPIIPANLLKYWQELITLVVIDSRYSEHNTSLDDVRHALNFISPDIDRDSWVKIGMALHWLGSFKNDTVTAYQLWNSWSSSSKEKYKGEYELQTIWKSFKPTDQGITISTLFDVAFQNGYIPVASVDGVFKPVGNVEQNPTKLYDLTLIAETGKPELDLNLIPGILRERALEVSLYTGCDVLSPIWAGLGAICGAVNSQSTLALNSTFLVHPVLWLMIIGTPGSKKTVGSEPMLRVLHKIEDAAIPDNKRRLQEWQGKEAAHEKAHSEYLKYCSSPDHQLSNDLPPMVPDLPPRPEPLRIRIGDITSQKLVRMCDQRPEGMLCYLDEMSSWIKKLTVLNSGEDRGCWVQAYESQSYTLDRVGDGSFRAKELSVSILGNIQNNVLINNMANLKDDGLIHRFMPAFLADDPRVGEPPPPVEFTMASAWDNFIINLHSIPATQYVLTDKGMEIFNKFMHWHTEFIKREQIIGADAQYIESIGKLTGLAGRITLVFHMIIDPYSNIVADDTLERGIAMVKTYIIPSLKYLVDTVYNAGTDNITKSIIRYVVYHCDKPTVTMRDIKRGLSYKLDKFGNNVTKINEIVMDSMLVLESANWVKLEVNTQKSTVWSIDPRLKEQMKEYRTRLIKTRQLILDDISIENYKKTGLYRKYRAKNIEQVE